MKKQIRVNIEVLDDKHCSTRCRYFYPKAGIKDYESCIMNSNYGKIIKHNLRTAECKAKEVKE